MTDISPIMIGSPETGLYKRQLRPLSIFDRSLIVPAIGASFRKLDPRTLVKNSVMFCVEIVAALTTIFFLRDLIAGSGTVVGTNALFSGQITVWLWFTVLCANFAGAVVEGAVRQKTPNEIALNILLAGMTLIFVFATVSIPSFASYAGGAVSVVVLIALFVTLIPTTIGALLSAIGIAGMDRLVRFNVLAMSGRAVEAAGDVDTLLLDKTGTITLGTPVASEFIPLPGIT